MFMHFLKCLGDRYNIPDVIVYFGDGRNTVRGSNGNLTALVGSNDHRYTKYDIFGLNINKDYTPGSHKQVKL